MQFDVYRNPIPQARRAFPYVAELQSNIAETGQDKIVAFLAPKQDLRSPSGRLMPFVEVESKVFALLIPSLTNLPASDLKRPLANLGSFRESVVAAIDYLFLGV